MGVRIELVIKPDCIDPYQWKAAYLESLMIIDRFPFIRLEKVCYHGIYNWYVRRTTHQVTRTMYEESGYGYWRTCGNMIVGLETETYRLFDDLEAYRFVGGMVSAANDGRKQDILFSCLEDCSQAEAGKYINIFGGKTGYGYSRKPLLAIACLICSRFPDAAHIYGNVDEEDCKQAVEWANSFLRRKIEVPVAADMKRLIPRLLSLEISNEELLRVFYEITMEHKTEEMGKYLREQIPEEAIYFYYRERLKSKECCETALNQDCLREYLRMGFDWNALCHMAVIDPKGPRVSEDIFAQELADSVVSEYLTFDGKNDAIVKIQNICREIFGESMIEEFWKQFTRRFLEKFERKRKWEEEHLEWLEWKDRTKFQDENFSGNYDIKYEEELPDFKKEMTIKPYLHEKLLTFFYQMCEKWTKEKDQFLLLDRKEREIWFLERYSIPITEEFQMYLFSRIMENEFIERYAAMYCMDTSLSGTHDMVQKLLWNEDLLNEYWNLSQKAQEE